MPRFETASVEELRIHEGEWLILECGEIYETTDEARFRVLRFGRNDRLRMFQDERGLRFREVVNRVN